MELVWCMWQGTPRTFWALGYVITSVVRVRSVSPNVGIALLWQGLQNPHFAIVRLEWMRLPGRTVVHAVGRLVAGRGQVW